MMNGTIRTTILATAAVAVPLFSCQIISGEILHGVVGRNESPTLCHWERGLTATFEEPLNQLDLTKDD